ncbi:LuxR family transcriptional regulator, maltose regulon positive regulatory protein [Sanguibacter gelidistatuariae]|uniref:LuxR family transcriptional regulator, maltose regulon positive regulatory protein n=1 Tax=Sanguibacter gelidistatuariae TaxID=1814289 RepID=A0A1G6JZ50_9MICO|nr:LuxR C-terminal-related transcriptional regulator [Sanguibacter gelidistatuariae]SDC23908.1 LuxR family transcriptional regulator, maltose regulon positive regulatory protein [Sanguibacter gelidistatuariae]
MTPAAAADGHRLPARKIHPPPPPSLHVVRGAAGARLAEGVEATSVTLLSAPTGYGKSTLLAAWATSTARSVAWLTIDELDNDATTLWLGIRGTLAAALARDGRGDPVDLADAAPPHHPDDAGPAIDDLVSRLDALTHPLALVLDNVDEIRDPEPRAMLDRLLRYAPPNLRLVLSGRFDPPLALQRVRAAGQLTELRHQDLRFSAHDALRLAELCEVPLTAEDQRDLLSATDGWPVAVKMALVAMARSPAALTLKPLLSPTSPIADLLVTDILAGLGPELAQFVLRATTCRRVDATLADALNGGDDGARPLAECVDRGLFLDRQATDEGEPASYRWHDFFAAQCQAKLAGSRPQHWRALHRSAAHYWRQRDLDEAVTHALRGGRPALAATYLHERWIELVLRGDHTLLLTLCHRIPAPLDESPEMLLLMAVCHYLDGDQTQADLLLRRAASRSQAPERSPDAEHRFALLEQLLGVVMTRSHPDLATMATIGEDLLRTPHPSKDAVVLAGAEHIVGQLLARAGRPAAATALLEASTAVAMSRSMTALRLAGESELSLLVREREGCGAGRRAARAVLDEAGRLGWSGTPILAPACLTLALCEYDRDDLGAAQVWAARALRTVQRGDRSLPALARATLLEIALATGDPAATEELSGALAAEAPSGLPPSWPVLVAVLDARRHLARGETEAAAAIVAGLGAGPYLAEHPGSLVWVAEILRRTGDAGGAREVLRSFPPDCRASQLVVRRLVVDTLLATADGDRDGGHQLLEDALASAEPDDVRRPFTDRCQELLPLLAEHLAWGTEHAAFTIALLDHLPAAPAAPAMPSYWSLTPREHEVLLYLRTTMTAADIASAAFVSINTVKTHQRAIYRKLGVEGRREAVRVATDRGLL